MLKFYMPYTAPVKFVAMDFPVENYYSITRSGFTTKVFKGRGTYKYKPTGRRFKVVLLGASCQNKTARPASAESSIVGGTINHRTKHRLVTAINNSIDNNTDYTKRLFGRHGSARHREKGPLVFLLATLGFGNPDDWSSSMFSSDYIEYPGYLVDTPDFAQMGAFLQNGTELDNNGLIKPYKVIGTNGPWFTKWSDGYFGPALNFVGCPVITSLKSVGYNWHAYDRDATTEMTLGMGMSMKSVHEIEIPAGTAIPEFTITVGACPDAWVGKKISIPKTNHLQESVEIEIKDTTIFDGAVLIIEEEEGVMAS